PLARAFTRVHNRRAATSTAPRSAARARRKYRTALPRQSGLTLAATITLPHFLVSSEMSLPKSAGEPASTVPPRLASRALNFGSAVLILTSLFSLSSAINAQFIRSPHRHAARWE